MRIVTCPICGFKEDYKDWNERDEPDCLNCGYPLKPETHPETPKQDFKEKILSAFQKLQKTTPQVYTYKLADVSIWNGSEANIDFNLFFSKVNGVIARSSAGANYYDPMFEVWKREANKRGAPFGMYHYFKPDKDLDSQVGLIEQSLNIGSVNLYPALDNETNPFLGMAGYKEKMAGILYKMFALLKTAIPNRKFMEYTSPGFRNANVARTDFSKENPLWVAHWTTALFPTLPWDWGAITNPVPETFWQKQLDPAAGYGLPSSKVDINYFRGTRDQFFSLFGIYPYENVVIPPPPVTGWPIPINPIKFEVISSLNVRSGPGKNFPVIQQLGGGEIVYAHRVDAPNEAWIEIDKGKWVALKYASVRLLKEL